MAYADILECGSLGSGENFFSSSVSDAAASQMAQFGVLGGALGGAIGAVIGGAIFGSSEHRKQKADQLGHCMYFK